MDVSIYHVCDSVCFPRTAGQQPIKSDLVPDTPDAAETSPNESEISVSTPTTTDVVEGKIDTFAFSEEVKKRIEVLLSHDRNFQICFTSSSPIARVEVLRIVSSNAPPYFKLCFVNKRAKKGVLCASRERVVDLIEKTMPRKQKFEMIRMMPLCAGDNEAR